MKRRTLFLAALALVLVLTAGIGSAIAYFTTYAEARGGYIVDLGDRTEIHEPKVVEWTKHVFITNDEEADGPVFVRARAYGPEKYPLQYSGEGWTDGEDGWWYYDGILEPGGESTELLVHIDGVPKSPESESDSFNVVVVYESTPVLYQADGTAYYDWNMTLDTNGGTDNG